MDFRSASAQPQPSHQPSAGPAPVKGSKAKVSGSTMVRWATVVLLFCITVLIVAIIGILASNNGTTSEQNKYVDTGKYQAVFLTNGQVYFGNISTISSDFLRLQNIYYLTQNTATDTKGNTTTDGNYTLVKLGCQQIHDPLDEMVVQRSQVSFWENLQSNGKVVTSINQFKKANPNGPDCSQVSNQTQASSSTGTQATSSSTGTTTKTTSP